MQTQEVTFFSEGVRLAALWRTPDVVDGPMPTVIQGPGWLGLKDANLYVPYHQALTDAGFGVLIFDYRGFGDSDGDRARLSFAGQLLDLVNGVSYLTTRDDVDPERLGVFGSGGTGGGNAVLLAAADSRIRAAVSQLPVADGQDWLHRMRTEYEWLDFLQLLDQDRRDRAVTGSGRSVHPREEIMVPTPERRATTMKADVDHLIPSAVSLAAADEILGYQPIIAARGLRTPLLVIAVDNDATTPTDHARAIFDAAGGPKEYILQRHTTHYAAYDRYRETVTPRIIDWFHRHLCSGSVEIHTATTDSATVKHLKGNSNAD